jgi:DNA-binding NarL/FixJ family response regulator
LVVLVDLELAGDSTVEAASRLRQRFLKAALVAYGEALSGDRAARLLAAGVSFLPKPVSAGALATLLLELCAARPRDSEPNQEFAKLGHESTGGLVVALDSYAALRVLSNQQRLILGLYLSGENDKQIARTISCSESTVYEHWRRIGRKAGGSAKADAISDFHRFLGRN